MKSAKSSTIAATLIATAAGLISWLSGLAHAMWPAHPQLGILLITVFTGIVVSVLWPALAQKAGF